jgi:hypothetical protein
MDYHLAATEHRLHSPTGMLLLLLWGTTNVVLHPQYISTLRPPLAEPDDLLEQGILAKSLQTSKQALLIREQHSKIPRHNSEEPSGLLRLSLDIMRSSRTEENGYGWRMRA